MALKLPYGAYRVDSRTAEIPQSDQHLYANYRGNCHYLAVDFTNGNGGVFGGGSVQKTAMEVEYAVTPRTTLKPVQNNRQLDANIYITCSKLLTIGSTKVEISF